MPSAAIAYDYSIFLYIIASFYKNLLTCSLPVTGLFQFVKEPRFTTSVSERNINQWMMLREVILDITVHSLIIDFQVDVSVSGEAGQFLMVDLVG